MSKRIPMTTEDRKRDKFATRNLDSLNNLPTNYKKNLTNFTNEQTEPTSIFCTKCNKKIPFNYWHQHQKNHVVLHVDYLRKRYDDDTRILK